MSGLAPALRQSLFIAGTDTGVGKTWVATRLLRALSASGVRAAPMKPVAAGAELRPEGPRNDDALALRAAASVALPYDLVNPCCLLSATSPHLAAAREDSSIEIAAISAAFSRITRLSDVIVVEGAGGWLAPIGDPARPGIPGPTMQEVATTLGLPVLLVVGIRLGCLSHALLTADAIQRCGLPLAGWIANPIDPHFEDGPQYVESLSLRLPAPRLSLP
jgi:dethiobiotin synthetase